MGILDETKPIPNIQLHDYQNAAENFLLTHPYCGLFMQCGMGKTLTILHALMRLNPNHHVLVIAPATIAKSVWTDEIEKWEIPFRTHSLAVNKKGKKLSRKKRLELYQSVVNEPPAIWFIGRDLVKDLTQNLPVVDGIPRWYYQTIIIDESQSFKSYKAERFKALCAVRPCIDRIIEASGTPAPQGIIDLWSQIYLLDMGQRLGKTITSYRNNYFFEKIRINNYPVSWEPRPGAEEQVYALLKDITLSMDQIPNRPPVIYKNTIVHMTDDELSVYKEMAREMVLSIGKDKDGNSIEITASNRAVLQNKLCQIAGGSLYMEDGKIFTQIHTKKLEMCEYIINNTPSPVLIAYWFKSEASMLLDHLNGQGIQAELFDKTPDMIKRWNKQQIPCMLIQPVSAGQGINIQDGGHTLIWYSIPMNLEAYIQTNARLDRQGQQHTVLIHHLITDGTVDIANMTRLKKKDASQKRFLKAVEYRPNQSNEKDSFLETVQSALDDNTMEKITDNDAIRYAIKNIIPNITVNFSDENA